MSLDKRLLLAASRLSAPELKALLSLPAENREILLNALGGEAPKAPEPVPEPVSASRDAVVSYRSVKTGTQLCRLMDSLRVTGPEFAEHYGSTVANVYQLMRTRKFRAKTTERIGEAFDKLLKSRY